MSTRIISLIFISILIIFGCSARPGKINVTNKRSAATPPVPPPAYLTYEKTVLYLKKGEDFQGSEPTVQGVPDLFLISPDLPDGLMIDPNTGKISGNPKSPQAEQSYTVTASNNTGTTSTKIWITITTDWWHPSSARRIPITIENKVNNPLADYQVPVVIPAGDTRFSDMDLQCSNLRFIEEGSNSDLTHWVESCGNGSSASLVWLKIPSLQSNQSNNAYLYFTTAAGLASNAPQTFDFFDSFETNLGWQANYYNHFACADSWTGHGHTLGSGQVATGSPSATGTVDTLTPLSGTKAFLMWVDCGEDYIVSLNTGLNVTQQNFSYALNFRYNTRHSNYPNQTPSGASYYYQSNGTNFVGLAHTYQWTAVSNALTSPTIKLRVKDNDGIEVNSVRLQIDDLFVRKAVSPEPTVTLGQVELQ